MDDLIKKGGVKQEKEEKTKLQKGIAIITGKAVPSDFKKEGEESSAPRYNLVNLYPFILLFHILVLVHPLQQLLL